jgi:hypothetical protein
MLPYLFEYLPIFPKYLFLNYLIRVKSKQIFLIPATALKTCHDPRRPKQHMNFYRLMQKVIGNA